MASIDLSSSAVERREQARRLSEIRQDILRCRSHPAYFLDKVRMPDERTAEVFEFDVLEPDMLDPWWADVRELETGWCWQRNYLDWILANHRTITLKARQLGVTWIWAAFQLWKALYMPGTVHLVYRQKEDDAKKIVGRQWDMLQSLPNYLRNGATILTPGRAGIRPSTTIEFGWEAQDGNPERLSRIEGKASTESAGHGDVISSALLDEFSRIDRASGIMKAVIPAAGRTGHIGLVSTANGRSNPETGEGNYYHFLWVNSEESGFQKVFLPWSKHPDRDQHWFDTDPEVRALRPHERAEQYPSNEHEAFTLTNLVYFDIEALQEYADERVREPLYRMNFEKVAPDAAKRTRTPVGLIRVFIEPQEGHSYAIGADVATGKGKDYSAAYVVDLGTMELCAEIHGRIDADLYSYQLHYLGRWYNTARIAIEMGGGYGEPVVIFLKDGKDGRPPYPKLFRYREDDRPDTPLRKSYGFPMTMKTRPLVLENLERVVRDRDLPFVSGELLFEMENFVHHDTNPSPRAQEGMNDDRVMGAAITLEMYRRYGEHPDRLRRKPAKTKQQRYPWQGKKPRESSRWKYSQGGKDDWPRPPDPEDVDTKVSL